jgi:hypothetical protein
LIRNATSPRAVLEEAGQPVEAGVDADHVIDLQLGGKDVLGNLKGLDASANRSLGSQIYHATKNLLLGTRIVGVSIG